MRFLCRALFLVHHNTIWCCRSEMHFICTLTVYVFTVADGEAINQYHALTTFQKFWNAIPEEDLLAVPLDPMKCKVFGGFAVRT